MKTPRTDLIVTGNSDPTVDDYEDLATFTRQLERELAELKRECAAVRQEAEDRRRFEEDWWRRHETWCN